MEVFSVLGFLALILAIGVFTGQGIGGTHSAEKIKQDCDRHGAVYLKDVRYSCKQEDHQATKEPKT